jgi:hypothetical protein
MSPLKTRQAINTHGTFVEGVISNIYYGVPDAFVTIANANLPVKGNAIFYTPFVTRHRLRILGAVFKTGSTLTSGPTVRIAIYAWNPSFGTTGKPDALLSEVLTQAVTVNTVYSLDLPSPGIVIDPGIYAIGFSTDRTGNQNFAQWAIQSPYCHSILPRNASIIDRPAALGVNNASAMTDPGNALNIAPSYDLAGSITSDLVTPLSAALLKFQFTTA